ncbi:probable AGX1 - alanine-glyoxylate transaminase [Pseudozyma flocculosa]|uniref:alanine--glyoxylate transaminase n=1 Tax=Pseudozyma flocculosa TaxID=84751 RepID=A0A5C3F062_9BASI|nr:probable AGX1 - alanine-glyoxylate transaminase [Pseudozyma flocculosa]
MPTPTHPASLERVPAGSPFFWSRTPPALTLINTTTITDAASDAHIRSPLDLLSNGRAIPSVSTRSLPAPGISTVRRPPPFTSLPRLAMTDNKIAAAPGSTPTSPTSLPIVGSPSSSRPSATSATITHATGPTAAGTAQTRVQQLQQHLSQRLPSTLKYAMSTQEFKQAPHKLLVIPGPIEVADDVLLANAHPAIEVLFSTEAQPVLTAGSGTLGWDHVAANCLQPGESALVLNSGYFGDSFAECLEVYGAKVDQIKAPIGSKPSLAEVEEALKKKKYKVLTFTHVDTSTGVLSDAKGLGELVKRVSPETILVLDGVCSVASEEIRMDAWGIDVVLTASQKGLGCPPGLMILAASKKAIAAFESRTAPPTSYYASWSKWLPVMKAYESGTGAYFGTPPTNLIYALHASLSTITKGAVSVEQRLQMHVEASDRVKNFVTHDLGLKQLVADGIKDGAHGMTAVRYPQGIKATDLLPKLVARNIVVAAGLHKQCKDEYFRIGHMGVTVVDDKQRGDLDHLLKSIKEALAEAGYKA